eukprot:2402896-Prorocentrum_lima.AAC.1
MWFRGRSQHSRHRQRKAIDVALLIRRPSGGLEDSVQRLGCHGGMAYFNRVTQCFDINDLFRMP